MLAAAVIVAAATITAHAPAWRGAFVSDDISEIAENPAIRVLWPPWVPMFEGTPMPHRPLPYYTFALNYAVHGLDPRGYHAVNLAIHLTNGWLVWWVGREILRRLGAGDAAGEIALAAATLWLVHPLCTQAVDYIYQRIESLGALAILGTVACFLKATTEPRPRSWLAASVAASATGMLCKEHVIAAPVAVLLVDWLVVRWRPERPWQSLFAALAARPAYYAALSATPLVAVALVVWQRQRFTDFEQALAGPLLYAANQPLVIGEYLRRVLVPAPLCLDWYRMPFESPAVLAPGIGAIALALTLAAWGVTRARGLALVILLFLVLLAPTSSVLPVNDLMVEHRMYLPLAVLCTGMAAVGHALLARYCLPDRRLIVGSAIVGLVATLLAATTWARCHAYQSRLVMWADVVMKSPRNPRGWQTLAVELWQAGAFDRALEAVDRSLAIVPDSEVTLATRKAIRAEIERSRPPADSR
jgi:protein O-mannosyl-transferase